jgi:Txe/YoeB family toxin of Txe-Axe toxin-antitoxin module
MEKTLESGITESGVKYTVLNETKSDDLIKLLEVYAIDKRKAKIIYEHRKPNALFVIYRTVVFDFPNGDFRVVKFVRKFGVSKSNIIYNRETEEVVIGFKNGKFYQVVNKRVMTLRVHGVIYIDNIIRNYFIERFGWLRNLIEDSRCHSLDLNIVLRNKLFNSKACLRHIYKVPYPVAKMLSENHAQYSSSNFLKVWKEMKKVLINVENLKKEFFTDPLLIDTTKMAAALGYKVNCSWSRKRLKVEHDKMAKEVVDVILEFEELRDLKINPVFEKFAEYSGYHMFRTNHELIEEGKLMCHCVGTYSGYVDRGDRCIYRIYDHTLELKFDYDYNNKDEFGDFERKLSIAQYMGFNNALAPKELKDKVLAMVDSFNREYFEWIKDNEYCIEDTKDELPF